MITVLAAQGLLQHNVETEASLAVLKTALTGADEWVGLLAVEALDTAGEKARPALRELQQACENQENKYIVRIANHAVNGLQRTLNEGI